MVMSVVSLTDMSEGWIAKKTVFAEQKPENSNLLSQVNDAEVTPENLGIPGYDHYGDSSCARNIWDMEVVDGKVLMGMGDYGAHHGAVPIYYYTNDSAEKKLCTNSLSSEAIERFFMIDGKVCAPATDPLGMGQGSYYIYDSDTNTWTDYYKLPLCVHCYEMVEYDGDIFFAGMMRDNSQKIVTCVQKLDKANSGTQTNASNVEFYSADGSKMYEEGSYSHC